MKLSGTAHLAASPDRVWAALNDPVVLARTIPGCHALNEVGSDDYTMTITAGVASIKGTYLGKVRISDRVEPTSYVLHASGSGGPGTVSADCLVTLAADGGGTTVGYEADAVVGGVIAGVGQRVIAGVAKKMAGVFFANVDADLRGERPVAAVTGSGNAAGESALTSQPTREAPLGRPSGPVDARSLLVGGVAGAAIALLGVVVGSRLGRGR